MRPADEQRGSGEPEKSTRTVCRVCGREIDEQGASAPFCSDRCRMADLGKWLSGDYRISRDLKDTDLESGD